MPDIIFYFMDSKGFDSWDLLNLAAEDTAPVTRKAEWAFSHCSSHLDILM